MKTFILFIIGLIGQSRVVEVGSFSIAPSAPLKPFAEAPTARARARRPPGTAASSLHNTAHANGLGHEAIGFWGRPRSEREIINFVSAGVFGDNARCRTARNEDDGGPPGAEGARGRRWVEVISAEPPLLVVHGFLERAYCDQIVGATAGPSADDAAGKHRLRRSTTGSGQEESGHRTSSTAWLREERCPLPLRTFAARAAALCGLPPGNMENLQVVNYRPGQEFQVHTDHLDSFNDLHFGGRLCTCLLYLNDSEQSMEAASSETGNGGSTGDMTTDEDGTSFAGGETNFPEFDRAVSPKKGSALFFWNTLERPGSKNYNSNMFLNVDMKLRHAGLPVLGGEKWVANRWIHPRDFGGGVRGF